MGVLQSGSVTPGHAAKWTTDGVLQDGGANPYSQRVLASLPQADFNTSTDQALLLPTTLSAFQLTGILIANASVPLTVAVGGFYPAISKAGSPLVANTQIYSFLTASTLLLNATLTAYAQQQYFTRAQLADWAIYLSLTAAQGAGATAGVYIIGIELG